MSSNTPKSLAALLQTNSGTLAPLLAQSRRLGHITAALHRHMPAPIRAHCQAGALRNNTLTISVDAPVWAAKLRYLLPEILEKLRGSEGLASLRHITAQVQPVETVQITRPGRRSDMSPQTGELLTHTAEAITHPGLKNALLRLSRHAK